MTFDLGVIFESKAWDVSQHHRAKASYARKLDIGFFIAGTFRTVFFSVDVRPDPVQHHRGSEPTELAKARILLSALSGRYFAAAFLPFDESPSRRRRRIYANAG